MRSGRDRYAAAEDLPFWLCLLAASALCIAALARPQIVTWGPGIAGADFVILQDGSSSMYVSDVEPDRWQRSMRFLRTFAETLSWKEDRVGLALFAYFVAPQLRLTNDPEAFLFFLDHLDEQSPFRLEDDPTWNTNIEAAIEWGLRLIETHEKLFGRRSSPKAFVVVSDGQAWTGSAANALAMARAADVSVHVVGVGSQRGGFIPEEAAMRIPSPLYSMLDRESLRAIARAGGGQYWEIGTDSDREVASRIISSVRRRAAGAPREERREDLYWRFLVAAAVILLPAAATLRSRTQLVWYAAAAATAVLILASV
jgi:Ca-activated chloride channel family protein